MEFRVTTTVLIFSSDDLMDLEPHDADTLYTPL